MICFRAYNKDNTLIEISGTVDALYRIFNQDAFFLSRNNIINDYYKNLLQDKDSIYALFGKNIPILDNTTDYEPDEK